MKIAEAIRERLDREKIGRWTVVPLTNSLFRCVCWKESDIVVSMFADLLSDCEPTPYFESQTELFSRQQARAIVSVLKVRLGNQLASEDD